MAQNPFLMNPLAPEEETNPMLAPQQIIGQPAPQVNPMLNPDLAQQAILGNQGAAAPAPQPAAQVGQGTVLAPANAESPVAQSPLNIQPIGTMTSDQMTDLFMPKDVQPGSPQETFLRERAKGELSPEQVAQAREFAASMGTTFDPDTGYSRDAFLSNQASRTSTPLPGQTLSQFMRYEDQPIQRTEQFVDPQGRLRRRSTAAATELMRQQGFGIPEGVQPLAPEYANYEMESQLREDRLAARPDFREAQPVESRQRAARLGVPTQAELRDLAQMEMPGATAGEIARGMEIKSRYPQTEAVDPLDRRLKLAQVQKAESELQPKAVDPLDQATRMADLQLKLKDLTSAPPDKLTEAMSMADRLGYTGPEREQFILDQVRRFSPQPDVSITMPGDAPVGIDPVTFRNILSDDTKVLNEKIQPGLTSLGTVNKMLKLLDSGEVITGAVAKPELYVKAVARDFGVGEFPDVATTQEYIANAGRQVGQVITLFGAGTGLSDKDREFAEKIAGGDISVPKDALKRIVQAAKDTIERETKAYDSRIRRKYSEGSGLSPQQQSLALNALSVENLDELFNNGTEGQQSPTPAPSPTEPGRVRTYNPSTGEFE